MSALKIYREIPTIEKIQSGYSIARFGDGELRLACGMTVGHQIASPKLREELCHILQSESKKCIVGIPYVDRNSPRAQTWRNYSVEKYQKLYNPEKHYYSAFITRPDSAPWIDNEKYWNSIKSLYQGKDITIIAGSGKGFRIEEIKNECKSLKFVQTLPEQAYAEIDAIEREVSCDIDRTILLCVGATATVLAWRLANRGIHSLDLGHVAMFMRRRGLFNK